MSKTASRRKRAAKSKSTQKSTDTSTTTDGKNSTVVPPTVKISPPTKFTRKNLRKPTVEEISERAYTLWLLSGRAPDRDEQNWLEAESQLTEEINAIV